MKILAEQYMRNHSDRESVVFNMMFHNVEVLPGLSPYTLTQYACDQYLDDLENFLDYCNAMDIKSIGLSDTYDIFKETPVVKMNTLSETNIFNMSS
jgi:hypothetical protein